MFSLCFVLHINSNPTSIIIKRQLFSTYTGIRVEENIIEHLTLLHKSLEVAKKFYNLDSSYTSDAINYIWQNGKKYCFIKKVKTVKLFRTMGDELRQRRRMVINHLND